jgi:hypothetical protein
MHVPSKHVSFSVNNFTPFVRCQFRRFKCLHVFGFHYPKKPRFKTAFGYNVLSRQLVFNQPLKVLRALFFFTSRLHIIAVTAYFRFPGLVTPVVLCQARNVNVHTVFSNKPLNAEAGSTA